MKTGRTLQELAFEIDRQQKTRKDYIANTVTMGMTNDVHFSIDGVGVYGINEIAHDQISTFTEIPARYYEKMMTSSPELLAQNVNHWLHSGKGEETRMLRTLDGKLRAFLSKRYRRIDNVQIAETVLPIISQMQGARVESCQITDEKMYLKVVNPRIQAEVRVGDVVQSGILISNSEVGRGSVSVSPLIYRLVCSNGMIAQDGQIRKYHIGKTSDFNFTTEIFTDETMEADYHALMLKIRDAVNAAVDQTCFNRIVEQMRISTEAIIEPIVVPKVMEMTSKSYGITNYEHDGVLGHLISGGDLSLYGMANAVTRYAQEVESYDRSTELEAIGFKIMTMPPKQFYSTLAIARKELV